MVDVTLNGEKIRETNIDHTHDGSVHFDSQNFANSIKERIAQIKQKGSMSCIKDEPREKTDQEIYREIANAANNFIKTRSEEDEKILAETLEKYNMQLYCYKHSEVSQDKRDVARMAFGGYVDRPLEMALSQTMRNMKNFPLKRAQTKPEDYDLKNSSAWQVFAQVPEFKAIEESVKKGLAMYGIPPEKLSELNNKDFCFLINDQFRSNSGKAKVFEQGYKAKNTIRFINENEADFRKGLMAMPGVRADYVDALVAQMKQGRTNLRELYQSDNPDDKNNRYKKPWPKEWDSQPVINVHHIINVKDANSLESENKSFANVNDYENMCFIVTHPAHNAMHALEYDVDKLGPNGKPYHHEDVFYNRELDKKMIFRIQPLEGVRCMLGFDNVMYDKEYVNSFVNDKSIPHGKAVKNAKEASVQRGRSKPDYARNNRRNKPDYAGNKGYKRAQEKQKILAALGR